MKNKINICSLIKKINITFMLVLFFSFSMNAQDATTFNLKIKFSVNDGGLENSLITITKNGQPYKIIDPSKTKYNLDLELGSEFLIVFTKLGYITKSISVDTHIPNGREKEELQQYIATVELDKQPENQEVVYTQPVGRIKYSVASGDFDADRDYSQQAQEMQKKAEANPKPKTAPPAPKPRPTATASSTQTQPPSNPIPVAVKPAENKIQPPPTKPIITEPVIHQKPIVRHREEKTIQEDRKKITFITIDIDGIEYIYKKEEYSWGGVYYYKNNQHITVGTYEKETE